MSKPISEMGWDELVPGAALFTFNGDINYNIAYKKVARAFHITKERTTVQ